jgi:hypothetical protein
LKIDRRTFVASSLAATSLSAMHPLLAFAQTSQAGAMTKPSLAGTFGRLKEKLVGKGSWSFYPTIGTRGFWSDLPADVREIISARADAANTGDWPQILATLELQFKRNGNRSRFEAVHFGRRGRLMDLVFGECLAAKGTYLDQIANGIWLICEESFWGAQAHLGAQKAGAGLADTGEPIIDLFAAETAATLSLIVHMLGDRLDSVSPLLLPRIVRETQMRVLTPYLLRNDWVWSGLNGRPHHLNNWNSWINSNILTTTLVLEQDPARRAELVLKVCKSTDEFLFDYSADGACEEGPAYWTRSAGTFFDLCQMLVSAHAGGGGSVLQHPFTRALGRFILNAHIAGDMYCNYGDAHLQAGPPPELVYRYGHDCNEPAMAAYGAFLSADRGMAASGAKLRDAIEENVGGVASLTRAFNALLVAKEIRTAPRHDALERYSWYPNLALMTTREKAGSTDGFYLAMQAAGNGRSHGHNDSGSILVFHNGQPLIVDAGVGTYEAKTFSKDRYTIWSMQSQYHNLPIIGGIGEHEGSRHLGADAPPLEYRATGASSFDTPAGTGMSANLALAYPAEAGVASWVRTATLDRKSGSVHLDEFFELKQPKIIALSFLTPHPPAIQGGAVILGKAALAFDRTQLTATFERIELTDPSFHHAWGEALYRVRLTTPSPIQRGSWKLNVHNA